MLKKTLILLFIAVISLLPSPTKAQDSKTIYHFYSKYCPHCTEQNEFFEKNEANWDGFNIVDFEVTSHPEAAEMFKKFADASDNESLSVPAVYIGEYDVIGYKDESTTGKKIEEIIDYYRNNDYVDPLGIVDNGGNFKKFQRQEQDHVVNIPLIGEVNTQNLSLMPLTIVLGLADGFNPCAMWALVALLGLLMALGSKRKVALIGGVFIVSSWLIYYVFLAAWLNAFYFIRFDNIIRPIIGIIALYTAWKLLSSVNKDEDCKPSATKKKIHQKIENMSNISFIPLLVLAAISLALMVNLVEFMCSINLPVIYTKVLSMANLSRLQYYGYLALYNTLYMLDDIIVFILALVSINVFSAFNKKYTKVTKIIGGVVILVVGLLLLLYPQALSF